MLVRGWWKVVEACKVLLERINSIKNGCINTFWAQKIVLKNSLKLLFYYLLLKSQNSANSNKCYQFFKGNFFSPKFANTPISYTIHVIKGTICIKGNNVKGAANLQCMDNLCRASNRVPKQRFYSPSESAIQLSIKAADLCKRHRVRNVSVFQETLVQKLECNHFRWKSWTIRWMGVSQRSYCRVTANRQFATFVELLIIFVDWNHISFFLFHRKLHLTKPWL